MDKELGGVPDRRRNERWMRYHPYLSGKGEGQGILL